jgi:hypothetical protein
MNQCLRCNEPCDTTALFCNNCRLLLQQRSDGHESYDTLNVSASPHVLLPSSYEQQIPSSYEQQSEDFTERITAPVPVVQSAHATATMQAPQTPPPATQGVQGQLVEQIIHKLNDAARRIAEVEQNARRPRASRLAPLRDMSGEIQRFSTPMPKATSTIGNGTENPRALSGDLGEKMPDLWPWLQEPEQEEHENGVNATDPLLARRLPDSRDIARLEAEDIQRARAEGVFPAPVSLVPKRTQRSHMRVVFFCLVVMAILALTIDSVLVSFTFLHPHHITVVPSGPPTLTVLLEGQKQNSDMASYGQHLIVQLRHFTAHASVLLTHDIGEPVQVINNGSSFFHVGQDGSADVKIVIDTTWQPGFHILGAEEEVTHITASAIIQIIDAGPSRPSHLVLSSTMLNLGPGYIGANTIQPLTLSNAGTSSISWSASSDQSWLMITPNAGTFSAHETIAVGVQRANLKEGSYKGKITFSSNVGGPETVQVEMSVRPVPANVPVLTLSPALISFTALDGGENPDTQTLVVSNPGSQPLSWSLTNNSPTLLASQSNLSALGSNTNWLTINHTSGTVVPGATNVITVSAQSQNLLPGTYINTLVFSAGQGTVDSPQNVTVSLTVQPSCGLTLSAGGMSFTAVAGQSNPANQVLGIRATSSCSGSIGWRATSSQNWLTMTPTSGQLNGTTNVVAGIAVNTTGLKPGNYSANILVVAGQSTQSVAVMLTVQSPLPPSAPLMGVSPLSLNFSTTQGQPSPPGQVVTITNTSNAGGNALQWHTAVNQFATPWLAASPTGGNIVAGQAGQMTVNVITTGLTPGLYQGQVVLSATYGNTLQNAGGSPQTVSINLQVLPPCALAQPSSSALAFTATQGGADPATQSITLTASGNCGWPLSWKSSMTTSAPWLTISPASGSLVASGQSSILTIAPSVALLKPITYTAQVTITATDVSGVPAQGSPQVLAITFTVLQTCALQVAPANIAFAATEGQPSAATRNVSIGESGNCARPVSWTASGDAGSAAWLQLSPSSGTDNGMGNVMKVGFNVGTLVPGTYKGTITISASGNGGALVQSSPQTVAVSLVVTGYSVSGSVIACLDITCALPKPLPGATVNILNSSGTTVATGTANAQGNYVFTNVPTGAYTLSASGTDSLGVHYAGNTTLNISGNQTGVPINTYPG